MSPLMSMNESTNKICELIFFAILAKRFKGNCCQKCTGGITSIALITIDSARIASCSKMVLEFRKNCKSNKNFSCHLKKQIVSNKYRKNRENNKFQITNNRILDLEREKAKKNLEKVANFAKVANIFLAI